MKIFAAFKLVYDEQDILVKSDRSLDVSKATIAASPFDLNAIEAAVEVKSLVGDAEVVGISVGGQALGNAKARKDVLSRGLDRLVLLQDDKFENVYPREIAKLMAKGLSDQGFDLVICGNGSADIYAQQTGLLLGEMLNVPSINGVSKIVSFQDGVLTVERSLEEEVETLKIQLPAVISVSADINEPQIPNMRAILAAAKKPVQELSAADLNVDVTPVVEVLEVKAQPQKERELIVIEGEDDASIAKFAEHVRKALN